MPDTGDGRDARALTASTAAVTGTTRVPDEYDKLSRAGDPVVLNLDDLLKPVSPEEFLRDDWGRATRQFGGSIGGHTAAILDLSSFEMLLGTLHRAQDGWLHLARDGRKPVPADMIDAEGMLDLARVRAAFQEGETLYLTKAQRLSGPLMRLCREVEVSLAARGIQLRVPVSAHVFLTPPRSQGFPPHRDEHSSFILQLGGAKDWDVYEDQGNAVEIPRPGRVDAGLAQMKRHVFTLNVGDVLYIPERWAHAARTGDDLSLHVTLRTFPLRWLDVLDAVLPGIPALGQAVPDGLVGSADEMSARLGMLLGSTDIRGPLRALIGQFLERTAVPTTTLPDNGLSGMLTAQHLDETTWLTKAAGVACAVSVRESTASLAFPGGILRSPAELGTVLRYVAATSRFRPADLPTVRAEYDRVGLARKLVLAGILKVDDAR